MPEKTLKKSDHLHIRIDPAKLESYRRAAEADGRTLSNWVEHTLDLAVKAATQKGD